MEKYIVIIIILILILVIIGLIYYGISQAKKKIQSFSRQVFGTSDIRKGIEQVENEYASTPKSIAAMTSLYLPQITKDFPDFNYEEMRERSRNVLNSFLLGLMNQNVSMLQYGNTELKNQLSNEIGGLQAKGYKEYFDDILMHRTEISGYRKTSGRCVITFQSSVQYKHYIKDENRNIVEGSETKLFQSKYNVDMIYIQDRSLVENELDDALAVNCPNCGAPLTSLGAKHCEYCGSPIMELNIHAWSFSSVKEL